MEGVLGAEPLKWLLWGLVEKTEVLRTAGVTGSPPGTVCGVDSWDNWVTRASTLQVVLSRSWETSAWSLSSSGGSFASLPESELLSESKN
jgi:hypothetical protein